MSGEVPKDDVLRVLRAHGVEISKGPHDDSNILVLTKDETVEAMGFHSLAGRQMLQRLKRKFGIPINHFYHPLQAPIPPDEKIQ